jgi:hypothetical protein
MPSLATQLWFGFVQIAGCYYSQSFPHGKSRAEFSQRTGDLRQAQLAALQLPMVGVSSAVDTGDWSNIHPPDKVSESCKTNPLNERLVLYPLLYYHIL